MSNNLEKAELAEQAERLKLQACGKEKGEKIVIGNCVTGKTHLMTAQALQAVRKGYSVRFYRVNNLLMQLKEAKSEQGLNTMLKRLMRVKLLVLDELGYISLDKEMSSLFFQLIANRYEVSSTIVTSNLEFSKWPELIGDNLMAAALVDRLLHRSTVLNMNGEGFRLTDGR